jgi:hypothetical protein
MLCINQRKDIKHHHLGQGKEILLFIKQRLKLTILVSHHSTNLVWAPLYNAPSAPSISLFSQSTNHLKEREWIEWKKRG